VRGIADISWSKKLFAVSAVYVLGLLSVGFVGGYTIFAQNKVTEMALANSQIRADAAGANQVAILVIARAQAQLLSAADAGERRTGAVLAIRASSGLDENIQHLQQALPGSGKVQELTKLLEEIAPAKMEVIKAIRGNDVAAARSKVSGMQDAMKRVEELSGELVQEERNGLTSAVAGQKKRANATVRVLAGIVSVGILVSVLAGLLVGRLMMRPLAVLEGCVHSLAMGNLAIQVPKFGQDELGRIVGAMGSMATDLNQMVRAIKQNGESLAAKAAGVAAAADKLQHISLQQHGSVEQIRNDANTMLSSTSTALERLREAATSAKGTSEVAARNTSEINDTISKFRLFQEHVERTATVSQELAQKLETIQSISKSIDGVSGKTKLLSLNAKIEAALAGQHGKGFAVVASEVGSLAKMSEQSAAEISSLTAQMALSVGETVELLQRAVIQARENIQRLLGVAADTGNSSQQTSELQATMDRVVISIGGQEQAVSGINGMVSDLFSLTQGTRSQTECLHGLSQELTVAAAGLNGLVDRFTLN
jgi:methyl-accepting chemotaxis protein